MSDLTLSHAVDAAGRLTVTIGGRLAIDTVGDLHALLREHLPQAEAVCLNAASLDEIDLSGVQLICAACHTALCARKAFMVSGGMPACMRSAIVSLGLQNYHVCKYSSETTCIWCGGTT